ncbi:hypothetical protein [Lentzea guizhouensis]|uniref:hypothetical protein n=1 Tax=Lentzea guizhouensis TaxID=1586287 RepID=UPI0012B69A8C|nr:hypothetical protein [Lentzea guizhouensis]
MLKKVGAAVAIAGAFVGFGSAASASETDIVHQTGVANLNETEVVSDINACFIDVNVIAVPVLAGNDSGLCGNPDED